MKRFYQYLFLCIFGIVLVCCGSKSQADLLENAISECNTAIENLNFARARVIVDSLINKYPAEKKKLNNLRKKVVQKEILYIFTSISEEDMLCAKTIALLEEEGGIKSDYVDYSLKLAINSKKTSVVKGIVNSFYMGRNNINIAKYLIENDIDYLFEYVKSLKPMECDMCKVLLDMNNEEMNSLIISYFRDNAGKISGNMISLLVRRNDKRINKSLVDILNSYIRTNNPIDSNLCGLLLDMNNKKISSIVMSYLNHNANELDDNMIKYLASRCEKRCNKVIIINKSANSPTISGKSLKAGIHKSDSEELGSDYQEYILSVENYNNYCRELLDLAIEQHNLSLAKQSLILFRKNMHAKDLGTYFNYKDKEYEKKYKGEAGFMESVVGLFSEKKAQKMKEKREEYNSTLIDHSYRKNKFRIYWDWTDRDDAKKILNSAINEGAFK